MGCGSSTEAYDQPPPPRDQPQPSPGQRPVSKAQEASQNARPVTVGFKDEVTDINVRAVKVDRDILVRYIGLEKEIRQVESKNVFKALKVKEDELAELHSRVLALEETLEQATRQTAKEKADVDNMQQPSVKQFFEDQKQYDAQLTKEQPEGKRMTRKQEEYLEALNRQEIAKKEVDGAKQQRDLVTNEVNSLKSEASKITDLYREQDELLAGIFDGKYGSELEYHLETQLDILLDRKQRIGVARYKWQNGRVLLQHAVNQLAQAVAKWQEVQSIRADNVQVRYTVATESRNSLVAAHQNIVNGQRYLSTIQFPYLKPPELDTLHRATNNIYTDMQTPQRHAHALNCYTVTHRRASALLQWFDYVIDNTIVKDLDKATLNVQTKERELRSERLRLIKAKIRDQLGDGVDLDIEGELGEEDGAEGEHLGEVAAMSSDNEVTKTSNQKTTSETGAGRERPAPAEESTTSVSPEDLAPPPSMTDIFGNIDELKKQHEKEMEDFDKLQELNKARMDQGLQEKLRARQSRRRRQLAQEEQGAAS